MSPVSRGFLFWTPRILTIVFILFLGIFALDVFGEGYSFGQTVVALFMHLIPNFVVLAVLIVAWRWEWVGAVLFVGLGAFYIITTWGRFHWSAYAAIAGPLFFVGALFFLNWILKERVRAPVGGA